MAEFLMPSLGSDMEDGTLIEWEKQPGDVVSRGDVIAVVETQKGAIEIEAYEDGILDSFLVDIGKKMPVGTPLAIIRGVNEAPSTEATENTQKDIETTVENRSTSPVVTPIEIDSTLVSAANTVATAKPQTNQVRITEVGITPLRVSPAARIRASTAGIDLSTVTPSGPWQSIVLSDIDNMFARSSAATAEKSQSNIITNGTDQSVSSLLPASSTLIDTENVEIVELTGMRKAIAASMSRAKREIPHYYLRSTIDLTAAREWLTKTNETRTPGQRVLMGALLVKAVAHACTKFPEFNGHFIDGRFLQSKTIHMGMAVNLRSGGLVAPAIHNAQTLSVDELMTALRDVVSRTRAGRFRSSELTDATITVSSLGDRGVDALYAVIYPPQVAILGFGSPADRPVAANGKIVIQHQVTATLAADHRVSDGHRGSRFLESIGKLLQRPEAL